jgi:hypothetical protein
VPALCFLFGELGVGFVIIFDAERVLGRVWWEEDDVAEGREGFPESTPDLIKHDEDASSADGCSLGGCGDACAG